MTTTIDHVPDDQDALKAALVVARAKLSGAEALIEHLQLVIAKMKRELFGPRSERSQRLLDQLELQLEELAAAASEDAAETETAGIPVQGFTRPKTRRNRRVGDCWSRRASVPRLIFNAKTLKLCSKIKFATQAQQTAPSRQWQGATPFDVFDHPGRRE